MAYLKGKSTTDHSAEEIIWKAFKTSFQEAKLLTSAELFEWFWNKNSLLLLSEAFLELSPKQ